MGAGPEGQKPLVADAQEAATREDPAEVAADIRAGAGRPVEGPDLGGSYLKDQHQTASSSSPNDQG
jgi:hypothetical protein